MLQPAELFCSCAPGPQLEPCKPCLVATPTGSESSEPLLCGMGGPKALNPQTKPLVSFYCRVEGDPCCRHWPPEIAKIPQRRCCSSPGIWGTVGRSLPATFEKAYCKIRAKDGLRSCGSAPNQGRTLGGILRSKMKPASLSWSPGTLSESYLQGPACHCVEFKEVWVFYNSEG